MTETHPSHQVTAKAGKIFNTVIYNHSKQNQKENKKHLRIVQWNLENFASNAFLQALETSGNEDLNKLRQADILTVNNANFYNEESNFRNQVKQMADSLNANYIFAPEFIEASPSLLKQNLKFNSKELKQVTQNPYLTDIETNFKKFQDPSSQFRGLKGNAIITKLPLKSAKVIRLPACYDWFTEEAELINNGKEKNKVKYRAGEGKVDVIRRGGRIALIAELVNYNNDVITVVSSQLENRAQPKCKQEQLRVVLKSIQFTQGPVILAIDLNNFGKYTGPQTIATRAKTMVTDPEFLAKQAINVVNPFSLVTGATSLTYGNYRKAGNPTVKHIPILLPNKAYPIYKMIKDFRFIDNHGFDFSGENELANSNERKNRRYKQSYEYKGLLGKAKKKVDWIFVKNINKGNKLSYLPHSAETLSSLKFQKDKESKFIHFPISTKISYQQSRNHEAKQPQLLSQEQYSKQPGVQQYYDLP
jgi:hypothetical protein